MNYEITDCIDAGTDYCPCHLAEVGQCILCSQLSGKTFCDCINWKGVCIFQEYVWNGNQPKPHRRNYICKVLKKELVEHNVAVFTLLVSHKVAQDLMHPGSYIFMRSHKSVQFYDTPISIMDTNVEENTLKVAIELKGIKTKSINKVNENENIIIRAPFWNGILGLKNIYSTKEGTSVVIMRGIGMAPAVPVLKKLYSNGNKLIVLLDRGNYSNIFIQNYLDNYNCKVIECNTLDRGEVHIELKTLINNLIDKEKINLIHCDGPDILNFKTMEFLDGRVKFSSCNNAKMCCGEGVCGSCSARFKGSVVKRLCKIQTDPINLFEGRRFI
jgi:dihydroorotate dehydrogenase electron transfer subunit